MFDTLAMQGLMVNTAIMTAAATVFGAIVVFILLFLVLERKKKSLIFILLLVLSGYGMFYWHMSNKPAPITPVAFPSPPPITQGVKAPVPLPRPAPAPVRACKGKVPQHKLYPVH